jgi:hypothetical protein
MRAAVAHKVTMQYLGYIFYSELKRVVLLNSLTKDNNTWLRVSNTSLFSFILFLLSYNKPNEPHMKIL